MWGKWEKEHHTIFWSETLTEAIKRLRCRWEDKIKMRAKKI
jgi:hypothetical protein